MKHIFFVNYKVSNISDLISNFLQNICANNVHVEPADIAISLNDQNALPMAATLISKSLYHDPLMDYHDFESIQIIIFQQKMHLRR